MTSILKTVLVAGLVVAGSATVSFAATTGGTTLAGMHNGAHAKRSSTMMKHHKMMHRKMMKSHKKM